MSFAVGGDSAEFGAQEFSKGFAWVNLDFHTIGDGSEPNQEQLRRQFQRPTGCMDISQDVSSWIRSFTPAGPVSLCLQRHLNVACVLFAVSMTRMILRKMHMFVWQDDPPPADLCFPSWEGPVLVALFLALVDAAAAVATVECVPWRIAGFMLILFGPCSFSFFSLHRLQKLLGYTLQFTQNPQRTVQELRGKLRSSKASGLKLSYCLVFLYDKRFVGSWQKLDSPARLWGWMMNAFTDEHFYVLSWVLMKKIALASNKNW